jgi:hypothetical protein
MTWRYHYCPRLLLLRCLSNIWKLFCIIWKCICYGPRVLASSTSFSRILSIVLQTGGRNMSYCGSLLQRECVGVLTPVVQSAYWLWWTTQPIFQLYNYIAAFPQLAAVLVSKLGVTLWACELASPFGSCRPPNYTWILWLGSGRPDIALFTIGKIPRWKNHATIGTINSSFWCQCHENS